MELKKLKNKEIFEEWLKNFCSAWEEKDPETILATLADTINYYETPFDPPYTSKEEIEKLWKEVPETQMDIHVNYDIISFEGNLGVAHWTAKFTRKNKNTKAHLDGIFIVKLNDEGLCVEFKQWWLSKEK